MSMPWLVSFYIEFLTLMSLTGNIYCVHYIESSTVRARLSDASEAINHMYNNLPMNLSMEEKCKRYAVLSSKALSERLPYGSTVMQVLTMDKKDLDRQYDEMGSNRISYAYMSSIDRYILTQLAPPFIELVDCLRRFDSSAARTYLRDAELSIISDLYKQVLGLPGTNINIEQLNSSKFRQAFCAILRKHFDGYFDLDAILGNTSSGPLSTHAVPGSVSNLAGPGSSKLQTEEQQLEEREIQRRELSRLKQRRIRIAFPEVRERNKLYQKGRRKLLKSEQVARNKKLDAEQQERKEKDQSNERRQTQRHPEEISLGYQPPSRTLPIDPTTQTDLMKLQQKLLLSRFHVANPPREPLQVFSMPSTTLRTTLEQVPKEALRTSSIPNPSLASLRYPQELVFPAPPTHPVCNTESEDSDIVKQYLLDEPQDDENPFEEISSKK